MASQLIQPTHPQRLDVRCNVGDVIVANLAIHLVFFFERRLDAGALARAFAPAITQLPIFAGRLGLDHGAMRIRCRGQGVPFTVASCDRTLADAIRSASADTGLWLIDPVDGATARWGWGPVCTVRVTHLADQATAIGFSWHHAIGDMQTVMHLLNAWAATAAGAPPAKPVIVQDRAGYLDEHLPADGALTPGVRCLSPAELARSALYLAKDARKQRTVSFYFSDDEITRMRAAYGNRIRVSANDVVCAQVSEALMAADPRRDRRTLAIVVNARPRCGLDPMLAGNIVTALHVDLRPGEGACLIAERIRRAVDRFAEQHCDMRINQRFLDDVGPWRGARCVIRSFNPARWNPFVTNLSRFGVHRIRFEDTAASYCMPLIRLPVAGGGALMEGAAGRGLVFAMGLPPKEFQAMSGPAVRERLHPFRRADDDIPPLHREMHG